MIAKAPSANAFNGETAISKKKSPERVRLVAYLLAHRGAYSAEHLANALDLSLDMVRTRMRSSIDDGEVVNVNRGTHESKYRHIRHVQADESQQRVSRREPITNACMPNGSRAYWAKHMAAFNAPPRVA